MILNVLKRDGTTELRYIEIGQNLKGIRVTSIVIENSEEVMKLTTPQGNDWMRRHLACIFYPTKK